MNDNTREAFEACYASIDPLTPTKETAWRAWQAAYASREDLVRELVEALELGRDYINSELLHRQAAYDGYPHKWATEREDLLKVDAVLAKAKGGAA